jgi:two-component system KDP operon response regulator KdpE
VIRRLLRVALTSQGHKVIEAETAGVGITAATNERPNLIILDLGLPGQDGIEVERHLRELRTIPIIVVSVRGHKDDKIAPLDAGADDCITNRLRPANSRRACAWHCATLDPTLPRYIVTEPRVGYRLIETSH